METENNNEFREVSANQQVLIAKILRSSKIKDSEYRQLKSILDKQVLTSYDAAVFIQYVLSMLKFRRTFLNGKHKAYKKCEFCSSRNNVERFANPANLKEKVWACETCALNLRDKVVPVRVQENA